MKVIKAIALAIAVLVGTGSAVKTMAECILGGNLCRDDSGVFIQGRPTNSNGEGIPSVAKATINVSTPTAKGQIVFCNDCNAFFSGRGSVCVSTGNATAGAYVILSTAAATANCL